MDYQNVVLNKERLISGHDEWDQWNIVGELEATKIAITKAKEE